MATWDEVRAVALGLPEVVEHAGPRPSWRIRGKPLAWERPLRRADLDALGDAAPIGPILGIRTVDLPAREELLAALPQVFFTTPHFDGYPAVLARLEALEIPVLEQVLLEIWLDRAPKRLVREHLARTAAARGATER